MGVSEKDEGTDGYGFFRKLVRLFKNCFQLPDAKMDNSSVHDIMDTLGVGCVFSISSGQTSPHITPCIREIILQFLRVTDTVMRC